MSESSYKQKSEFLIDDGTFVKQNIAKNVVKTNVGKVLIVALCINFCLAVTFFSLYMTKTETKAATNQPTTFTTNQPTTKKGY